MEEKSKEQIDCMICREQAIIPAKVKSEKCGCWNDKVCCLNCIYNGMEYDGKKFNRLRCFYCNIDIAVIKPFKPTDYYEVKKDLMDDKEVECYYNCGWKGSHFKYQKHLRTSCPDAKNTKCSICRKVFTKSEYFDHVKKARNIPGNNQPFCADEKCCPNCEFIFKTYQQYLAHQC